MMQATPVEYGRSCGTILHAHHVIAPRALKAMILAADRSLSTVTDRREWRWAS